MQRMNPVFEENLRRTQNLGQKVAILCETSQSIQDELLKQRSAALDAGRSTTYASCVRRTAISIFLYHRSGLRTVSRGRCCE
jgi:hypothetical protein